MTKELELFKRWFEWDPFKTVNKKYNGWDHTYIKIGYDLDCFTPMEKYDVGIFVHYKPVYRKQLKNFLSKQLKYIGSDTQEYGDDTFTLFVYKTPKKYHPEWEQYVKENTDDPKSL